MFGLVLRDGQPIVRACESWIKTNMVTASELTR